MATTDDGASIRPTNCTPSTDSGLTSLSSQSIAAHRGMGRGGRPLRARRRRPTGPGRPPYRLERPLLTAAAAPFCPVLLLLLLLLLAGPLGPLSRVAAHDSQPPPSPPPAPCPPQPEPVPQETLDLVMWERSQGQEEEATFYKWFGDRVRENSLSEYLRDRLYEDEVEKLNPTCSVIGFLLRTMPVCPVVRKLEACAYGCVYTCVRMCDCTWRASARPDSSCPSTMSTD